jgi:hypothetical protein
MVALRSDPAEAVNRSGDTADDAGLERSSLVRVSVLAVFIAGTVVTGLFVKEWTDPFAELRGWLKQASGAGLLLFPVLFLALNTAGVPAPVLGAAAGATFGPVSGAAVTLVTLTITACAQFLLARHVVGERVRQRLGHSFVRVSEPARRDSRGCCASPAGTLQRAQPAGWAHFVEAAGLHDRYHSRLRPEGTGLVGHQCASLPARSTVSDPLSSFDIRRGSAQVSWLRARPTADGHRDHELRVRGLRRGACISESIDCRYGPNRVSRLDDAAV